MNLVYRFGSPFSRITTARWSPLRSLCIGLLLGCSSLATFAMTPMNASYLEVPFSVVQTGPALVLEVKVEAKVPHQFALMFLVSMDKAEAFEKVRGLMGSPDRWPNGKYESLGSPLSVRLKVDSLDPGVTPFTLDQTIDEIPLMGYTANGFIKKFLTLELPVGRYKIQLENLRAAPELAGVESQFLLRRLR